ncbi:hypothetical protein HID58_082058 [Brassica napus]|uniref:Deoxynucleoside kinase domain-containing protein n=1 Tax=Brassica napus TaxID=3708 RepID=A0ABQ7Y9H7_BRANA|nr:hypothetical protein HID58_082058 [Brassica napus]
MANSGFFFSDSRVFSIPDGFIYLRASPDTCHKRMMLRKRADEGGVSLKYLQDLHEKHESWLLPFESGNHRVLSFSKLSLQMDNSLHPDIKDRILTWKGIICILASRRSLLWFWTINQILTSREILKQRDNKYAQQVADFFEFVKKKQETSQRATDAVADASS